MLAFLVAPMIQVVAIGTQVTEALAGLDRTQEVLREKPEDLDPKRTQRIDIIRGTVEFDGVSFEYEPGKPVLHDVSFIAEPGTVTALGLSSLTGWLDSAFVIVLPATAVMSALGGPRWEAWASAGTQLVGLPLLALAGGSRPVFAMLTIAGGVAFALPIGLVLRRMFERMLARLTQTNDFSAQIEGLKQRQSKPSTLDNSDSARIHDKNAVKPKP